MSEDDFKRYQELVDRVMDAKLATEEGAIEALQQAGIVDENGDLTEPYQD